EGLARENTVVGESGAGALVEGDANSVGSGDHRVGAAVSDGVVPVADDGVVGGGGVGGAHDSPCGVVPRQRGLDEALAVGVDAGAVALVDLAVVLDELDQPV